MRRLTQTTAVVVEGLHKVQSVRRVVKASHFSFSCYSSSMCEERQTDLFFHERERGQRTPSTSSGTSKRGRTPRYIAELITEPCVCLDSGLIFIFLRLVLLLSAGNNPAATADINTHTHTHTTPRARLLFSSSARRPTNPPPDRCRSNLRRQRWSPHNNSITFRGTCCSLITSGFPLYFCCCYYCAAAAAVIW